MEPHARLGIRLRSVRQKNSEKRQSGPPGKNSPAMGTEMAIKVMLSSVGMAIEKIPFWKKLYRQGRRG